MEALSALLSILNPILNYLPKDPRTLLRTKTSYSIVKKCGGEYYYFGIKKNVIDILSTQSNFEFLEDTLQLQVNIDDLPLFKSSNHQFWPILGRVENIPSKAPFVIGIFSGISKPTSLADFFHDFINEVNEIKESGVVYQEKLFQVVVSSVICDAPAKAFIKNVKQYSAILVVINVHRKGNGLGK